MNAFRLQLRFIVPLFLVIAATAYLTVPLVDQLSLRWTVRDLNSRSQLIANTISENVIDTIITFDKVRLESIFNRLIADERVLGVGLCDHEGQLREKTTGFPDEIDCATADEVVQKKFADAQTPRGSVHLAVEPLHRPP